jgi:peptide/nickel transport system ATP-binding protein
VVESGDARSVLAAPQHPYSKQLKDAVLVPYFAAAYLSAGDGDTLR